MHDDLKEKLINTGLSVFFSSKKKVFCFQAVGPCLMNMAVLCPFWPNKLQLSQKTQQTLQPYAWSPSRGEH